MKQNTIETGLINAAAATWIPPTTTFAAPPASPVTGAVYMFTDALWPGATVGGGSSLSTCRWSGTAWVSAGGGGGHGFGADFYTPTGTLSAGPTAYVTVPVGGTIMAWNIIIDAGSCTVTIWKKARGSAKPTVADSISTSGLSLSGATAIHSTALTDFTTLIVANGDLIAVHLQAAVGCTQVSFGVELI